MRKRLQWQWEQLDDTTHRAQVVGGWLIHVTSWSGQKIVSNAMTFVADPEHMWTILPPEKETQAQQKPISEGY